MFPSAPDVDIYAPNVLFVGHRVVIEIAVEAKKETKVDFIKVRMTGNQGWRIGSGKNQIIARAVYPDLVARVMDEGVLQPGAQRFTATFLLPEAMPPTHEIAPAWARLDLKVHVSIPWWPDGRYRFRLPVRVPAPDHIVRTPIARRSTSADAAAEHSGQEAGLLGFVTRGSPRLELSLASTRLIAGEVVAGSCAVFHLDDRKPREVELSLVPSFKLIRYGRIRERRGDAHAVTLTIPAGGAGTSVPFRFELPRDIAPSFSTITHQLEWWLVAKSGSFFSHKVEVAVPLDIVDASAAATTARLETPPRLSDERVTAAFEGFAQANGWHKRPRMERAGFTPASEDDEDEHAQLAVEREASGTLLRIGYDYRGKDGTFLVARVACSLGLGLSVTPSSALRELVSRDIEIDFAEWDRAHHVEARSTSQTVPFLTALVPAVMTAMRTLGPLARWTDHELVFERAVMSVGDDDLAATAGALDQLASALAATPSSPPTELVIDLDAWRRLALRLNGELTLGDLSIEGELDQLPVDLGLEFDVKARPRSLRVYVGDPASASEQLRAAKLGPEHLAGWPKDFGQPQLTEGVASASLMFFRRVDTTAVLDLVQRLRGLIATLDPAPGPYR